MDKMTTKPLQASAIGEAHGNASLSGLSAKEVLFELIKDFVEERPINETLPLLHRLMQAVARLATK